MDLSSPQSDRRLTALWIAFGLVSTVVAGSFLIPHTSEPAKPALDPELLHANRKAVTQLNLRKQEDHPVTREQQLAADSLALQLAPDFDLPGIDGRDYSLKELTKDRPLLIFFIEKNCPCCLGAKYYVDRMQDLYASELNTVGIINAGQAEATKWKETTQAKFAVLKDPELKVIKAFGAERGVYTTLVAPGGKIAAAYPGYGKAMLADLGKKIAEIAGISPRPYKALAAPDRLTSGCKFPEPK